QIKECFAGCVGGLLSIFCSDVKLNLRIPKTILNVKISDVLCKYENSINDDMLSTQIKIHNLYAGEKKNLPFKNQDNFEEENNTNLDELIIIEADVDYFNIRKGIRISRLESPATLKVVYTSSQINSSDNLANPQVIQHIYRHLTTRVISKAINFAEKSDYYSAQMIAKQLYNSQTYNNGGNADALSVCM
ncbi:26308_t:CDS:2, partial [Racocetra persica]